MTKLIVESMESIRSNGPPGRGRGTRTREYKGSFLVSPSEVLRKTKVTVRFSLGVRTLRRANGHRNRRRCTPATTLF